MDKIVKITLWLPDQEALKKVMSVGKVRLECRSPKRDSDGNFVITVFSQPEAAKKITALQYRQEVDENYGEVLKKRQREVSRPGNDRFQGGKVKPQGLGIKR